MSIYKRKNRGKRSRWFTAEFTHRKQVIRKTGFPDRESAKLWLNAEQLKLRRGAVGYVKPMLAALVAPLIAQFTNALRAKGRDAMYCYTAGKRLERLAADCPWMVLGDVTQESIERWAAAEQAWRKSIIGNRTKNQYIDTAVEWGKWLASSKIAKLPSNPLAHVEKLHAKHNDKYRRAGTEDELNRLLAACSASRRVYYLFRIYTPMRARTIGGLRWSMMHLDAEPPFANTPAEWNKSRKEQKHVIRYDVAQMLRKARKRAKADDPVFLDAPTIDDLRADLAKAGIKFADADKNRRFDFHALRRTLVKIGKRSGLSLHQVSALLGHRDIRTTQKYYDEDSAPAELGESLEKLPSLGGLRRVE